MDQKSAPEPVRAHKVIPDWTKTPEMLDSGLLIRKMAEEITKRVVDKMVTSQECMQLKRDLEAENVNEFEISPAILCLILTFVVFVIAFWVWLISRSCVFDQVDNCSDKRLHGGQMSGTGSGSGSDSGSGSKTAKGPGPGTCSPSRSGSGSRACSAGRMQNSSSDMMTGMAVPSRPWRSCPINLCRQEPIPSSMQPYKKTYNAEYSPTTEMGSSPIATSPTKTESLTREASRSSETFFKPEEKEMGVSSCRAVAGSPSSGYQVSSFSCSEKGFPLPTKKYRVQWSKFIKIGQKDKLNG
ncbi:uncharacterized protein LOC123257254 [Drosophila ananassae]|uniref:uncharacterized protein LOC123257254 n=1 Tax=Drosophila ananassae TaxID=7217 RepID=UPI001CFF68E4|nr:uncharacterized protein LOC123257254 [Drosophila ananassae]